MSININTNFGIAAPNPIDDRYLSTRTSGGMQLPYSGITEVLSLIPESRRYAGLTVLIDTGTTAGEFWFREGVADLDLIPKTIDIDIPQGDFITGATNIGYFSGASNIQILEISTGIGMGINYADYAGNYCSLYNYYYRGSDAAIHIGASPSDGFLRRAYVKNELPIKSWIWNESGGTNPNSLGWIFMDGNVASCLDGQAKIACPYGTPPHTETGYTHATSYPSASFADIDNVYGNFTGVTITIGARPYAYESSNRLHFRTIVSETPNILSVRDDETFIHLSGVTAVLSASNVGAGANVLSGQTDTELFFRTIRGSGDTIVTTVGNEIIVYASISGQTSITGGTNIGFSGGTDIFAGNDNKTMQFRRIVGSGDTVVSQSGDTVVIFTDAGEQTYNLQSPSVIPLGGIPSGTTLTGKTAFELFEQLLVPELCGSITDPSILLGLTCSGNKEVGTVISQTVTGTFSRGSINPQYCSLSPYRSGEVNAYCFVGEDMPIGWQVCTTSPASQTDVSYTVVSGIQTWGVCAQFDAGLPALGSKGTEYCAALTSGSTSLVTGTITGIYPYFYGVSTTVPTPNSALLATGSKTVATSTSTLNITYGVQTAKYLWFATPAASTTKQGWYEGATNKGNIGTPSDLFNAPSIVDVDSPESCWNTISYKIYISNYPTDTSANLYCMTNTPQQ